MVTYRLFMYHVCATRTQRVNKISNHKKNVIRAYLLGELKLNNKFLCLIIERVMKVIPQKTVYKHSLTLMVLTESCLT